MLGAHNDLLVVPLNITSADSAQAAAKAAVDRFGRMDVLLTPASWSTSSAGQPG